jgi:hypothetical protein
MVDAFHTAPLMAIELMHRGTSQASAGTKEVGIAVIKLPLNGQIGRLLATIEFLDGYLTGC